MQDPTVTVLSQYAGSPTIGSLISSFNAWLDPTNLINLLYTSVQNVDTATGYGLDRWGRIVGVSRILTVTGYGNYALSDSQFRTLINAKALANISNGSIPSINSILMTLFPGTGDNYCTDGRNMTMTLHLAFTPTQVQYAILALPGVIPKPVGVAMTITSPGSSSLAVAIGSGSAASGPMTGQTFGANTATASGGSGSYSYAWTYPASAGGTWAIAGAATATATPSVSGVANGATATATLLCTVTDTITGSTATASVGYSLNNTTVIGSFTVSIGPGATASGFAHTFAPNSVSVVGGSGSFTYLWFETDDANATWTITGGATATATLGAAGVPGTASGATLYCTVTDTVSGASVTSSGASYVIQGGGHGGGGNR